MRSIIHLLMVALIYLLQPAIAYPQTITARTLEMSHRHDTLATQIEKHTSHTTAPCPNDLVEHIGVLRGQLSDLFKEMGSLQPDDLEDHIGVLRGQLGDLLKEVGSLQQQGLSYGCLLVLMLEQGLEVEMPNARLGCCELDLAKFGVQK